MYNCKLWITDIKLECQQSVDHILETVYLLQVTIKNEIL